MTPESRAKCRASRSSRRSYSRWPASPCSWSTSTTLARRSACRLLSRSRATTPASSSTRPYPDEEPMPDISDPSIVTAEHSGVVTQIAHEGLVKAARRATASWCRARPRQLVRPAAGCSASRVTPGASTPRRCTRAVILRLERTLEQDLAYGIGSSSIWPTGDSPMRHGRIRRRPSRPSIVHEFLRETVRRKFPDGRHYDEDRRTAPDRAGDDVGRLRSPGVRRDPARRCRVTAGGPSHPLRAGRSAHRCPEDRRPVLELQRDLLLAAVERRYADDNDIELASGSDSSGIGRSGREPAER